MATYQEIIDKLRDQRRFYGSSLRELARETGYSWNTIHHWERYKKYPKKDIGLKRLIDWAKALGFKVELVDDEEED